MDDNLPTIGTTRRSFIKRSVVAAVAVSSMSIFSGLVNAAVQSYYCVQVWEPHFSMATGTATYSFSKCFFRNPKDCGEHWDMDCGDLLADRNKTVFINCPTDKEGATDVFCYDPKWEFHMGGYV